MKTINNSVDLFNPEENPELHFDHKHKYVEQSYGYFCPICNYRMSWQVINKIGNYVCRNAECSNYC